MPDNDEYQITPADQALFTQLVTSRVALAIQEAYAADKVDQPTYTRLYGLARRADMEMRKLQAMLEEKESI